MTQIIGVSSRTRLFITASIGAYTDSIQNLENDYHVPRKFPVDIQLCLYCITYNKTTIKKILFLFIQVSHLFNLETFQIII